MTIFMRHRRFRSLLLGRLTEIFSPSMSLRIFLRWSGRGEIIKSTNCAGTDAVNLIRRGESHAACAWKIFAPCERALHATYLILKQIIIKNGRD
jgi:hypothetical protein